MQIVIPTYKRANAQKTLSALNPIYHKNVTLVIRPEEEEVHRYL